MKMKKLVVPFEVKALNNEDPKYFEFEWYASTFGNVDDGGDRIQAVAFTKTLREWSARPDKLPVLWQHDTTMPVGVYVELAEDAKGQFVKGRMPKADTFVSGRVIPQMEVGSIAKMSIGYSADKYDYEDTGYFRNL